MPKALFLLALLPAVSLAQGGSSKIYKSLRSDLKNQNVVRFDNLLNRWKALHGSRAVDPLLKIALDNKESDPHRYVAIMGMARLGGKPTAKVITEFLNDRSWMIRNAALKALGVLKVQTTGKAVLPLLRDPALVVRTQAIATVKKLKPKGAVSALVDTLHRKQNFHKGRAQWVPNRALDALLHLGAGPEIAPELAPLLKYQKDRKLQEKTVRTLDRLTGQKTQGALGARVKTWQKRLAGKPRG